MRAPVALLLLALGLLGCEDEPAPELPPYDELIHQVAYCPEWYPPDLGMEGIDLRTRGDGTRDIEVVGAGLVLRGATSAVEVDGERYGIDEEIPGLGTFRAEWRHVGTSSLVEVRAWIEGEEIDAVPVRYLPLTALYAAGLDGIAEPVVLGAGGPAPELAAPLLPFGPPVTRDHEQLIGGPEGGLYVGPAGIAAGTPVVVVERSHASRVGLEVQEDGRADRPATALQIGLGVDPAQVLARAATYAGYRSSAETCSPAPAGWSSGPAYGWPSNPAVLDDGQAAVQDELGYLGGDLGLAAGGWYDALGSWDAGPAYPAGVDAVAEMWGARGGALGLWLAPFWVADEARLHGEHPEALLRDAKGELVPCALAHTGGTCAVVDATGYHGATQLQATGDRLYHAHGVSAAWLDHLDDATLGAAFDDPHARGVTNLRAGLGGLRELAPGVFLVAVDVPPWQVAGLVDAVHPGPLHTAPAFVDCLAAEADTPGPRPATCDVIADHLTPLDAAATASWDDVRARAATLAATAHWNDALAALDLGPLVVAGLTPDEARTAATLHALAGGTYLLGDRLADLPDEHRAIATAPVLQELRRTPGAVVPDDRLERPLALPTRWRRELPGGEAAVAVVNWDDEQATIAIPLPERDVVEDLWDPAATWSDTDEGAQVAVPPHGVRLLRVR